MLPTICQFLSLIPKLKAIAYIGNVLTLSFSYTYLIFHTYCGKSMLKLRMNLDKGRGLFVYGGAGWELTRLHFIEDFRGTNLTHKGTSLQVVIVK